MNIVIMLHAFNATQLSVIVNNAVLMVKLVFNAIQTVLILICYQELVLAFVLMDMVLL